jgi:outer membrane murein-binding lipoprotein Lpp
MDQPEVVSALSWLGWLELIKRIGGFMVIAGVAIEVGGDWISGPFHKVVEDARQLELSTLNNETARLSKETETARKETAEAKLQISQANERAAQLEKEAAQARLELMQLQNPRMIRPDKLAEGLAGKPTAKVEIWYVSECSDCHWLATWLAGGLQAAGWTIVQGKPLPIPPAPIPFDSSGAPAAAKGGQLWGVSVLPSDGSNPAAVALSEVLLNEWKRLGGGEASDLPDGVVRITVAPRP